MLVLRTSGGRVPPSNARLASALLWRLDAGNLLCGLGFVDFTFCSKVEVKSQERARFPLPLKPYLQPSRLVC